MVLCSYAYGDIDGSSYDKDFNCTSSIDTAFSRYKSSTNFYAQANAHIEYCVSAFGETFVRNDQRAQEFRDLKMRSRTARSNVNLYTSIMHPGNYKHDPAENSLNHTKTFASQVKPFCDSLNSISAATPDQKTFLNDYCSNINTLAGMNVQKSDGSSEALSDADRAILEAIGMTFADGEDALAKLFMSCSRDGDTAACEEACKKEEENPTTTVRKDFVCRMDSLTRQCFQTGTTEICRLACNQGHHEDRFTCQIADGRMEWQGEGADRRLITRDEPCEDSSHVRNPTTRVCGPACDPSTSVCTAQDNTETSPIAPDSTADNNTDTSPVDPTNSDPTNEDLEGLANLADNIGNRFSNSGFGGSSNSASGGSSQIPDTDVKGQSRISSFKGGAIGAAGELTSGGAPAPLPAMAALPYPVQGMPGGSKKNGPGPGGQAGGNRGAGGAGGNFGGGNSSTGGGGKSARRGGGRGMPYKEIRENLGGNSYHGATGSAPATAAVDKPVPKRKRKGDPGVPGTKANSDYQLALNNALKRGLTKVGHSEVKKEFPCNTGALFNCVNETTKLIRKQGVLNAKGH